jgi:hypothetical protein
MYALPSTPAGGFMRLACSFPRLIFAIPLTLIGATAAIFTTGCGSSGITPPKFSGNTSVTVLLASTGNDQVTRFAMEFQTLTLTSQSGKTITLLSSQQPSEFMHMNGGIEPLTTVSIPQDIYTSATATLGSAVFVCIAQVPGGNLSFVNDSVITQGPTVNLASPITVTGSSMALLLNMQVSSSAVFPACWTSPPFEGFSMTPTFDLTPIAVSASPANSGNGKVSGLTAEVASVGTAGSSLTLTIAGGPFGTRTLSVSSNSATVFQGIGASALSIGMFLNVDGAIQSDGSLLATRIALEDPSAINDSSGPVVIVSSGAPILLLYGRTELGSLQTINGQSGYYLDILNFDFSNAAFTVSGQFTNLHNLPFGPSFGASNMVSGQDVDITSGEFSFYGGGSGTPANTITLVPQTINATVVSSQQVGNFTDYTVSLAPYDLFPTLAVQQGQTTLLNNPSQVEVYIDSNTQKLNTQALAPGSTLRFYGLVFNDNGTLRMDCAQVNDGVALSPPSSASQQAHMEKGVVRQIRREGPGSLQQTISVITRQP